MSENEINDLMNRLEDHGYSLEYEGPAGIHFWGPVNDNGDREYLEFKTWEDVKWKSMEI